MELCLTGLTLKEEEEISSTIGGDSYYNQQQQEEQFDIILQSRHRDFKSHINMSDKHHNHQLKPKTTAIKKKIRRPPSSIQVQLSNKLNDHVDPLDLSFSSSTEDYYHTMNSPGDSNNKRSRSRSPNSSSRDDDDRIREEEWSKLLEKTPPLNRPLGDGEPYIGGGSGDIEINPQGVIDIANNIDNPFSAPPIAKSSASSTSSDNNQSNKPPQPKSILRRRLSSKQQLSSQEHQKRQQIEIQSILSTLEELQHNFVTNDNSTDANSISNNTHKTTDTPPGVKEYTTISYPNGNLFSGTVSSSSSNLNNKSSSDPTQAELIYGRMTCALEMEVYEGPFKNGKRHGEGAVCTKLDGGAKFLGRYVFSFSVCLFAVIFLNWGSGEFVHILCSYDMLTSYAHFTYPPLLPSNNTNRYHEGQMHSGTLITKDFTYTGTFLNNDFHGIGTIISLNGSIYQGQLQFGQYHGVGMLRTVLLNEEVEEENVDRVEQKDRGQDDKDSPPPDKKKTKKNLMESVYTGDFNEGLFHGHGSLTHSDGSSYVGTWHEGKRIKGTETFTNGDVFEGKFVNDVREGQGILKMKCGRVTKSGIWENDQLKEGEDLNITFGEGHVYCGDHVSSVPHGKLLFRVRSVHPSDYSHLNTNITSPLTIPS